MKAPSQEAIDLSLKLMTLIGKRRPLVAAQALLLCMRAVKWVSDQKNDIKAAPEVKPCP